MTKTKSTKRALLTSALALLMCISMLVGTTFAWFTDSVSSTNNIIKSGNLDVELEYLNGDSWEKVTATTNVFEKDTLWEPGHTEVVYLKVSNLGTLALKYNLGINIVNEIESVNVYDEKLRLSEYIEFGAIEDVDTPYADRDTARDAVTNAKTLSTGYTKAGEIEAGAASDYVALVVYMPETVGNEANYKTGEVAPQIDLGINLMATQYTSEEDSFDNKYDENALFNSLPVARVTKLAKLPTLSTLGGHDVTLDVGYVFETVEDEAAAQKNDRRYWHADFVATLDKDTHTSDLGLWGKYAGYDFAFELDLLQDTTIPANTPVRMLELYNGYMNYEELCRDVKEFYCGAFAVDQAAMDGVTMTVELRLYETTIDPNANSGSANIETGEYVVINKYSYTFGAKKVADAAALEDAIEKGGEIVLTADIDMGSTKLTVAKDVVLDLNGYTVSGTCEGSQAYLFMVNNGATMDIKDSSAAESGKITYAQGTSNVGWAIDLEGQLNLYSGTIELTGDSWSIGYAVDVRPNAWGTNYTEATVFTMYGGKVVSSFDAIRVASTSSDTYSNIVAGFVMEGGEIDAARDGIFMQQSNAAYDTLSVEIKESAILKGIRPIRVYGPNATSVNAGTEKPMTITADSDSLVLVGALDTDYTWHTEGKIAYKGGMTLENLNQYSTITLN